MTVITAIIETLTANEKKEFIQLLKRKNTRYDTKNIILFKLLNSHTTPKDIQLKLYKKPSKGAYHALCKRLHDNLIDFIASKSFKNESSEEMEVLKLLVASRTFFEHKQYAIGFSTLAKAKRNAKKYDLYSILNEIYYTQILYAQQNTKASLPNLIHEFKNNQELLKQEENFTLFYASVTYEIEQLDISLVDILESNFSKYSISVSENLSYKSFFFLLEVITNTANINRDYKNILPFIENTYKLLKKEERLIERQLFYHIQIIYYVANSHFRNRNFNTTLHYLSEMLQQMHLQQRKYYNRFLPQYTLLYCLTQNFIGNALGSIQTLECFNFKKYNSQISYSLDLRLALVLFYFQQSQFKKALEVFNHFHHSDYWYTKKASNLWVIQKNLIELLIYIELNFEDLLESRLKSFSKKHISYLNSKNEIEVIIFFKLITSISKNFTYIQTKEFNIKIKQLKDTSNLKNNDIFYISFYAWLISKQNQTNLYENTLKTLQQSNTPSL